MTNYDLFRRLPSTAFAGSSRLLGERIEGAFQSPELDRLAPAGENAEIVIALGDQRAGLFDGVPRRQAHEGLGIGRATPPN